ncbi:MAG: PIG-L family deacetylase [Chloroflexota bacterium]|nr:PIG-L family deacetylase [Chloroflexota bacterium]
MVRVSARWLLCLPLIMLLSGCSVERQTQRISRLYDAVRSQPQIQPPADYVPAATPAVGVDPIAKADVLVFATRPGDAVVSAYTTIRQAVAQGKRVVIVYVTNGDAQSDVARALAELPASATPTPSHYLNGASVLQELAIQVAGSALGVEPEDVIFLAYPDGALHELTAEAPDRVVRSPYTEKDGLFDAGTTPYRMARSGQGVPYSFNAILHDLNDVLVELNPREIYLPSPESTDATVAAVGRLIARSLREVVPREARVFVYLQESDAQPSPDRRVPVTDPAAKQRALDMYAAGGGSAGGPDLPAALLEEEGFWEVDYTKPM